MSTESALSYAALILADSEIEISSEKLNTLVVAAGVEIESIWADLFAKALDGKNLKDYFFNIQAGSASGAAASGAVAASGSAEAAAEEVAEEAKEESDDDMGFGLFD
ncbi:hypothetical protein BABINDRAFT_163943 [Babjeviella inositovora NRRL Y-12698]|uniref:60S acidic ribosomal protein P1 n=1 Tax=Babjeviella inositovora NRRL Y-12698 TaxID=984486 RepID=A0A1E3QGY1_9ASCO|nr:uncharacterized protein BABINDRAFT_163943 [Babjeviella inositovora NRRL Y-12698]ODQ76941.1 hypothetical protein BABINDRAFT_163943 [Babjeviella inositovora NRRL Y-12698]